MNCRECQDLLQLKLDGIDVPTTPELHAHLEECPACRQDFQAAKVLLAGLTKMRRREVPNFLSATLVAGVLDDRRRRQRAMRLRVLVTSALAASLLVVVGLSYYWSRTPTLPPMVEKKAEPPREEQPARLAQSADEAAHAMANLTKRVAEETSDQAKRLMKAAPAIGIGKLPEIRELEEFDSTAFKQAGQMVAQGFEPVARSARRAIDLFKEMPVFDFSMDN